MGPAVSSASWNEGSSLPEIVMDSPAEAASCVASATLSYLAANTANEAANWDLVTPIAIAAGNVADATLSFTLTGMSLPAQGDCFFYKLTDAAGNETVRQVLNTDGSTWTAAADDDDPLGAGVSSPVFLTRESGQRPLFCGILEAVPKKRGS